MFETGKPGLNLGPENTEIKIIRIKYDSQEGGPGGGGCQPGFYFDDYVEEGVVNYGIYVH